MAQRNLAQRNLAQRNVAQRNLARRMLLVPPTVLSATVLADGVTLRLACSQPMTGTATLGMTRSTGTITSGTIASTYVNLVIPMAYTGDSVGTLSYDAGAGDLAGVYTDLASFSGLTITNASEQAGLDSLFTAAQYGDFMRASDNAPAASGGLLTRWTGQRAAGNAGMRFDATPFANAPLVGAYGPGGTTAIKFDGSALQYFVGSADRGGASSLATPVGPDGDTGDSTGFVFAARIIPSILGATDFHVIATDLTLMDFKLGETALSWNEVTASVLAPLHGITTGTAAVVLLRRKKDRTTEIYVDGVLKGTAASAAAAVHYRWLSFLSGGASSVVMTGYFVGHIEIADADVAAIGTWLGG